MYPPWSTTFDAHVHRGRIMHVMVKDRTAELKSEATVALDTLATRCKKENGKLEIWVRGGTTVSHQILKYVSKSSYSTTSLKKYGSSRSEMYFCCH